MAEEIKNTQTILNRAEEILSTAKLGYEDLKSTDKGRRYYGLRNLIVFGRSVTFVIQNLKSTENDFESWYQEIQAELKKDPLMKYFVDVRNNILKQGKMNVTVSATVNIQPGDMKKLGQPPPGATSFFIGDDIGGSGWVISLPDGIKEKYYVNVPTSMADVKQQFPDLPDALEPELKSKSIEELCLMYIEKLEKIVDSARDKFISNSAQVVKGKRLPPYLRVVK